jgi:hypothetical protein
MCYMQYIGGVIKGCWVIRKWCVFISWGVSCVVWAPSCVCTRVGSLVEMGAKIFHFYGVECAQG